MNVSTATAWLCRIKLYKMMQDIYGYCDTFNSITEADSSDVKKYLQDRLKGEAVLVTDGHHSYKYLCHTNNIRHVEIPSKQHFSGTFNLGRVNSLHSSLKRFLGKHADRPATKYLDLT